MLYDNNSLQNRIIMKRSGEKLLSEWLLRPNRKPLVIRGARQVGKSTLVRLFATSCKKRLIEINLERHRKLGSAFSTMDVPAILKEIEIITGHTSIDPQECILFLDEIQAIPAALSSLRYFYEELPDLPVIAAGSLLEFTLQKETFSMPVGRVEYFYLGPMTFEEFLDAQGETRLLQELAGYSIDTRAPFPSAAHEKLCAHLRTYYFVGGMPEAVAEFLHTKNFGNAGRIHTSIIETYRDDFGKYASARELERLQRLFDALPGLCGGKFKWVKALADEQPREVRAVLGLLVKAGLVTQIFHSSCTGLPLASGINEKIFKIMMVDIGLLNAGTGTQSLPQNLLLETALATEGTIAEQFVCQHLLQQEDPARRPAAYFWTRDGKTSNAEVDFVVVRGGKIIPVEVKSGKSGSLRSLHQFIAAHNTPVALRFDLNPPSAHLIEHKVPTPSGQRSIRFKLISLPLYMVEQAHRFID